MPSPTTTDEFLELVRKSEIVEEKKLTAYLDKVRAAQALPSKPAALAGLLVRDGVLTRFQAEQLLQGKWRRFCLGKYKVLEKLGAGGMGIVYLCEHKLMRRRVAVKVLPESSSQDPAALERFYREARAVAALDHPNIVRAYDIDQDGNLHFLVMEHVDGSSLQEIVKKTGPMDVLRACHYIRQAALGLQHAHQSAGIVHRDIKPGNILVDRNGIVKILDMGLARFFRDEEDVLTRKYDEDVLGTADYLAPEQAVDSHSVDIRADIYSLGATFYFCLTGRTPFPDGTIAQKLIWHQTRQPKPISQLRPEVPGDIAALVEKMMAKDPEQRPQTPQEVADALAVWTQTPIPPPPEHEMPQLSPAVLGIGPSGSSSSSGPKTPGSGNPLSPTPRKVWQVSQSTTPASSPTPTTPRPSPVSHESETGTPAHNLHKTNPPRGQLNLELSPQLATHRSPAAIPQVQAVPASVAEPLMPPQPEPEDKKAGAMLEAVPFPTLSPSYERDRVETSFPASFQPGQEPSWGELLEQESDSVSSNAAMPHALPVRPRSALGRGGRSLPTLPLSKLGWVLVVSFGLVVGLFFGLGILVWIGTSETDAPPPAAPVPAVFYVNPHGGKNTNTSIAEILHSLHGKSKHAARIIVQDDIAESDVLVNVPHVAIEAEEGKAICWRPGPKPTATKLFAVHKAEGVYIKGFTLDGEGRLDFLVNLFHRCPGAKLEALKLQGFKKYGIWVTNCEGSPDRPIEINQVEFVTTHREQTALFFSIEPGIRNIISKDRHFAFHDCTFVGSGTAVKSPDPADLESIVWPANIRPVQGR